MKKKARGSSRYGNEAPSIKEFLIVILVMAALMAISWTAYYKWHLFH